MTEIEQIKERNERRKRLISEGASADSKTFVEQVYEMKEVNRLIPADFDYLITTIESQKVQLETSLKIEGIYRDERDEARSYLDVANSQIESLKAITELAVKKLEWYAGRQYGDIQFSPPIPDIPILHDCGDRAIAALEQISKLNTATASLG